MQEDQPKMDDAIAQKEAFLKDIKVFFSNDGINLFVEQCNQLLATLTLNNVEMFDVSKNLVNYVFDCFMPEMQEEVVRKKA